MGVRVGGTEAKVGPEAERVVVAAGSVAVGVAVASGVGLSVAPGAATATVAVGVKPTAADGDAGGVEPS